MIRPVIGLIKLMSDKIVKIMMSKYDNDNDKNDNTTK